MPLLLLFALTLLQNAPPAPPVHVAHAQPRAYVERSAAGQLVNCDFDQSEIATRELAPAGNYVVIDHGDGEFSIFMHLKQRSAKVKLGDAVKRGQVVGAVGASGSSLFPHLHYELRDGAGYKTVEGLPSYFHDFRRHLGAKSADVRRGQIDSGDIVEAK